MLPLEGIKVVDLTQAELGPRAAMLLADMGADVIKIEPRQGEYTRPVTRDYDPDNVNIYFLAHNRNKRGIAIDYTKPKGLEVLYKLIASADVFVQTYAPGVAERHGLDYETVKKLNPRLVYCRGCGFGIEGPMKDRRGMDIVFQAYTGMIHQNGPAESNVATPMFTAVVDQCGALCLAFGIMVALYVRGITGKGQQVTGSLLNVAIWQQAMELIAVELSGKHPPKGNRGHNMVKGIYWTWPAKDRWFVTGGLRNEKWDKICEVLGAPELVTDPRFENTDIREKYRDELVAILDEKFRARTADEWVQEFLKMGVITAPVNDYHDFLNDPVLKEQVTSNGYWVDVDTAHGKVKVPGVVVQLSETPGSVRQPAPEVGEHNHDVLTELGYTWDDIAQLYSEEVL